MALIGAISAFIGFFLAVANEALSKSSRLTVQILSSKTALV